MDKELITKFELQKNLRDKDYINVIINYEGEDSNSFCYTYDIIYEDPESTEKKMINRIITKHSRMWNTGYWDTYEEALDKGLKEALIIKKKIKN